MARVGGTLCPVSTKATHVAIIEFDSPGDSGMVCFWSGLCVWLARRFAFVVFFSLLLCRCLCLGLAALCPRPCAGGLARSAARVCLSLSFSVRLSSLSFLSPSLSLFPFSCACVWRSV